MKILNSKIVASLPILFFLGFFYYFPLLYMLNQYGDLSFTFEYLTSNPLVVRFTIFTISQAIFTVIISLMLGVPAGYYLARTQPKGLSLFRTAFTVPFLFPPLAILMGFVIAFDRNGILNQISAGHINFDPFSFTGIVLAHTIFNISIIARIVESALYSEPNEYHDLAIVMGASKERRFFSITLPHIRPSVEAAVLLVFLYAFNSFAVVLILGEVQYQTIEVMIYNQSRNRLRYDRATALAIYQMLIDIIVILLYLSRKTYQTKIIEGHVIQRSKKTFFPTLYLMIVSLLMWFPVIVLLFRTSIGLIDSPDIIQDQLISGHYDQFLGTSSKRVILNTLIFGTLTSIFAIIFGIIISYISKTNQNTSFLNTDKMITLLILIPMTTSAITLSFAMIVTYGTDHRFNEYVWVYILGAHILATLPFSSRIIQSARMRIPEDLLLVSKSFGANPITEFRLIIWPYMKGSIMIAGLFALTISIGEFGSTLYLVRGEWVTLSLAINKLFSTRNALLPNLYALILIGFATGILLIIEKIGSLELRL